MSSGTLARLRVVNRRRAVEAFNSGAWSIPQWACAIFGEAGELANMLKKRDRGHVQGDTVPTVDIADECADIFIYCDLLCDACGIPLPFTFVAAAMIDRSPLMEHGCRIGKWAGRICEFSWVMGTRRQLYGSVQKLLEAVEDLCNRLDISLAEAISRKFDQTSIKIGSAVRFYDGEHN